MSPQQRTRGRSAKAPREPLWKTTARLFVCPGCGASGIAAAGVDAPGGPALCAHRSSEYSVWVPLEALPHALPSTGPTSGEPLASPSPETAEARLAAAVSELERVREALRGVSNAYGCFAGCTGSLRGAPPDGSGHTPACKAARAALSSTGAVER